MAEGHKAKISQFVPGVQNLLGNRQDIANAAGTWIAAALLDITTNYEFEELRVPGPIVNFQVGVASYSLDYFINSQDTDPTQFIDFFMWLTTSNPPNLGVTGFELKYRRPMVVKPMSVISGTPVKYTQIGRNLIFGFCPNQAYSVQMSYQKRHPLDSGDNPFNFNQTVFLPIDWWNILTYMAAEFGANQLRMLDYAQRYHVALYGDPKKPGDLGLIQARLNQQTRDMSQSERQLQPVVGRYSAR